MTSPAYEAPGPGTWDLDATHVARPLTPYTQDVLREGMPRGFKEGGDRFGTMLAYLKVEFVNGFLYNQGAMACVPEDAPPGPPPEGFFDRPEVRARIETGCRAIAERRWRDELRRWDEEVKPDSIRRNTALQAVHLEELDGAQLIAHLRACRDNAAEMFYRHHVFTFPSLLATGLYLLRACAWAKVPPGPALELLAGSSPVSAGVAATELCELGTALRAAGIGPEQFEGVAAAEVVEKLRSTAGPVARAMHGYLEVVGSRLVSGYDVNERTMVEVPELLLGTIWAARAGLGDTTEPVAIGEKRAALRSRVPEANRAEFDEWLAEARLMNRLRDERGVYNDSLAMGVSRRAILEAGRRLTFSGLLDDPARLLFASHDEMVALLQGAPGPTAKELAERAAWSAAVSTDDAPPFLGPAPQPPPPPESLPEEARELAGAIGMVMGTVFDDPTVVRSRGKRLEGLPVSPGVYEGVARLVLGPGDFHRIQQGDVLVTRNTSASFNVVMPLLGALITDRGGQLSHAAIVAREFGIPGVVSTRIATTTIADGSRVRVDGERGTLEILD